MTEQSNSGLQTEEDYKNALRIIDVLWDAEPDTMESTALNRWVGLVEEYERIHYPISKPSQWARFVYWLEKRWRIVLP